MRLPFTTSQRFRELKHFLTEVMQMQHIYQPVIIAELLKNGGRVTTREVAKVLLGQDESQIDYYEYILDKSFPPRVLQKHGVATKVKKEYALNGFDELKAKETIELTAICQQKINDYMDARRSTVWEHRGRRRKAVPGSVRYEVLKRAKNRCELCGVSKDERALDVDHIVPRSLGGKDDLANYQALCYLCNTNKNNTDTTDFRNLLDMYIVREEACLFCNAHKGREILAETTLAYVIADNFPVTERHCLVIPKRHVASYFELTTGEVIACNQLLADMRQTLQKQDNSIRGFNIGVNDGQAAGQSIFHCHTHLIPRQDGDVERPKGGIRNVIPSKGDY